MSSTSLKAGIVRWFDTEKGFGVVGVPSRTEYFLHGSQYNNQYTAVPLTGIVVTFQVGFDNKKGRAIAQHCVYAADEAAWELICDHYLGKEDIVGIEQKVTYELGRGGLSLKKWSGKSYTKTETHYHSILELGMRQILRNKTQEQRCKIILYYAESSLSDACFVHYFSLVESCIERLESAEKVKSRMFSAPKDEAKEKSFLSEVFDVLSANRTPERVFRAWKAKKFHYISYTGFEDFELPEEILHTYNDELTLKEYGRIKAYSYGTTFIETALTRKIAEASDAGAAALEELDEWIELADEPLKSHFRKQVDELIFRQQKAAFEQTLSKIPEITLENYKVYRSQLQREIPDALQPEEKELLKQQIDEALVFHCNAPSAKVDLWLNGMPILPPLDWITDHFNTAIFNQAKREEILIHLPESTQEVLLKLYAQEHGTGKTLDLLGGVLARTSRISTATFKKRLHDDVWWQEKEWGSLVTTIRDELLQNLKSEEAYSLFLTGYLPDLTDAIAQWYLPEFDEEPMRRLCEARSGLDDRIQTLLLAKISVDTETRTIDWGYNLAKEYLSEASFRNFDREVYEFLESEEYFRIWTNGKGRIFPDAYVASLLQGTQEIYEHANGWVKSGKVVSNDLKALLLENLRAQRPVENRTEFYRTLYHIRLLLQLDDKIALSVEAFGNSLYNLLLWHLEAPVPFKLEMLLGKFIYFNPKDQVKLFRKIFHLKETGQLAFSIEDLAGLMRFDLDLYRLNRESNPDIPVDISTDVVLQALLSYARTGKFLMEGALLKVVLENIRNDRKTRFKIGEYFEKCRGRMTASFDGSSMGSLRKIPWKDTHYFSLSFEYSSHLVEEVKKIPGRKWNPEEGIWGVPASGEAAVLDFVRRNRFFIETEGGSKTNNKHLFVFSREREKPVGITYCEGRLANQVHDFHNREFWWCTNQPCFQNCDARHEPEEWESYTLLDFCRILGFNLDEIAKDGAVVADGHYTMFVSRINRFNRLLDHLYCKGCDEVLYPTDISNFAAYTVVRFHCENESCEKCKKEVVYLSHCLNGKCNTVIDSRISKRCPNGLLICNGCGSCCSHAMLERRLVNLKLTGGYIHNDLVVAVNNKLGHLERAEYFCHKDGSATKERPSEVFSCPVCSQKYDTQSFNIKRPHRHLNNPQFGPQQPPNNNDFDNPFSLGDFFG